VPSYTLVWPSIILAIISIFVVIPVFVFHAYGVTIRKHSKYCQKVLEDAAREAAEKEEREGRERRPEMTETAAGNGGTGRRVESVEGTEIV